MLERIHDLYDELERHRVMLSFKGALSPELVTALLGATERRMEGIEPDARTRKRVFNVVLECLQNLYTTMPTGGSMRMAPPRPPPSRTVW